MKIEIVALYASELPELGRRPGVERRTRGATTWTTVPCDLTRAGEQSIARPRFPIPRTAPRPQYRTRLVVLRDEISRKGFAVVLAPRRKNSKAIDPELRILKPIRVDHRHLLFEFAFGEVVYLSPGGCVERRFVEIDRDLGEVRTRDIPAFQLSYLPLVRRCEAQIRGTADMFPPRPPLDDRVGEGREQLGGRWPNLFFRAGDDCGEPLAELRREHEVEGDVLQSVEELGAKIARPAATGLATAASRQPTAAANPASTHGLPDPALARPRPRPRPTIGQNEDLDDELDEDVNDDPNDELARLLEPD